MATQQTCSVPTNDDVIATNYVDISLVIVCIYEGVQGIYV